MDNNIQIYLSDLKFIQIQKERIARKKQIKKYLELRKELAKAIGCKNPNISPEVEAKIITKFIDPMGWELFLLTDQRIIEVGYGMEKKHGDAISVIVNWNWGKGQTFEVRYDPRTRYESYQYIKNIITDFY